MDPKPSLSAEALDQLFRQARTHSNWLPDAVPVELLHQLYDLTKMGPTSVNSCPARFVFLTTPEAKERLVPALMPGNIDKTRTAPVTVIIAYDTEFYDMLPKLVQRANSREMFASNHARAEETAFRNGSLQGAYVMLAARALGLDCGPMSGFFPEKVDAEFFHDGKWKVNFLCNLGYGDGSRLHPRNPRLEFDEACRIEA